MIDCETTTDERQALTFGSYRYCRSSGKGEYICVEEGLFYADDLQDSTPEAIAILQDYANSMQAETPKGCPDRLRLLSRSDFMKQAFWRAALDANALIVGFNLPFDLSRLAVGCSTARPSNAGWSLVMSQDKDPKTGRLRNNPFRPRIQVKPIDSKASFIRLTGVSVPSKKTGRRLKPYTPGRFLDLRMLGWALRNQSYSLQSACEAFQVSGKLNHEPTGRITTEEIDYCRQDVRATVDLLNAMRKEFDRHPISLLPDKAYSPASIAKAYLKAMGIVPPSQKFELEALPLGIAMQGYYGGRAECRIRHTVVPVVHTDFLSEYPTVNSLMGLWPFLTAENLAVEDATAEVKDLLANVTSETVLDQDFWKTLPFFALVRPDGEILPVRASYNGETSNIGANPLTSVEPIWYAGPDVVAAALVSDRPPEIIRALRIVPVGQQAGLNPVRLRNKIRIDPRTDDFFRRMIESRNRVKVDPSLPKAERDALSYFLKILANSGSYGLFVEVNPKQVGNDPKTGQPARAKIRVLSGEHAFEQTSPIEEKPGRWYCPVFGALITAAGRLLLALLEGLVTDAGGTYLLCDTDSMAIVASENGGLVPCVGGSHSLPDGRAAVKALSWEDVREIVHKFEKLNPYDREAVSGSILKIEDVNFCDGVQRELFGYGIAAKRYVLFRRTPNGDIKVEKASAHGLGFLYPPIHGYDAHADAPTWVAEGWDWILRGVLGLSRQELPWFEDPAMMRIAITSPEVLKVLLARQQGLPYRDRVKPFNFALSPILDQIGGHPIGADPNHFMLIAPFTSDPSGWYGLEYVNVHDGKPYGVARSGKQRSYEAGAKTYGDFVKQYCWHPEAKSLAPNGDPCTARTEGLLKRTPVTADSFRYIGKETDRRWEHGEHISVLEAGVLEYRPNETAGLVADPDLQRDALKVSIRALAKKAGVSERTVKAARKGKRIRRSTAEKFRAVLRGLTIDR